MAGLVPVDAATWGYHNCALVQERGSCSLLRIAVKMSLTFRGMWGVYSRKTLLRNGYSCFMQIEGVNIHEQSSTIHTSCAVAAYK